MPRHRLALRYVRPWEAGAGRRDCSGGRWRGALSGTKLSGLSLRSLPIRNAAIQSAPLTPSYLFPCRLPRPAASCAVSAPAFGSLRPSAPTRRPAARRLPTPCGKARAKPMEKLRLWIIPVEKPAGKVSPRLSAAGGKRRSRYVFFFAPLQRRG